MDDPMIVDCGDGKDTDTTTNTNASAGLTTTGTSSERTPMDVTRKTAPIPVVDINKENYTSTTTGGTGTQSSTEKKNHTTTKDGSVSASAYAIPWVEKFRPRTLDDVLGNQETIIRLRAIAKDGNIPNLILCGPPGTGMILDCDCCDCWRYYCPLLPVVYRPILTPRFRVHFISSLLSRKNDECPCLGT
jgi:hypothetical protein